MPKEKSSFYTKRQILRLSAIQTNNDLNSLTTSHLRNDLSDSEDCDEQNNAEEDDFEALRNELFDDIVIEMSSDSENDQYLSEVGNEDLLKLKELKEDIEREQEETMFEDNELKFDGIVENEFGTNSEDETDSEFEFDFEEENIEQIDFDSDEERNDNTSSASEESDEESFTQKNESKFKQALTAWALKFEIPLMVLTALLLIIRQFTNFILPRDARTLLRTPRNTEIRKMAAGGEYHHFGLKRAIESILNNPKFNRDSVNLIINIDGLPISKSSTEALWPIMCSDFSVKNVYLVGVYHGFKHPQDSNEFLQEFTDEISDYCKNGFYYKGKKIDVNFSALVCDTPAKKLILKVKGHTGYDSCPSCEIKGQGIRPNHKRKKGKKNKKRVCFPGLGPFTPRTDEKFRRHAYKGTYQEHGKCILCEIPGFGPVSRVPRDYMHLVLLGLVKKLIWLWILGPPGIRLDQDKINRINKRLQYLRNTKPSEFNRRPRSIRDFKNWKATEFRSFLLYTGPVVVQDILNEEKYKNFLALHTAIGILCSAVHIEKSENIDYAHELLRYFISSFQHIYGEIFMSHNFHNVLHVCEDVKKYGNLDSFSAFRFENYMSVIKKKLRRKDKPLQQLARRYAEMEDKENAKIEMPNSENRLKNIHARGPLSNDIINVQRQYKKLKLKSFTINCDTSSDNCVLLKNGSVACILNIIECDNKNIFLIGNELSSKGDLYNEPLNSSLLNIKLVSKESNNLSTWRLEEVQAKLWRIRRKNRFSVVFPILHTENEK